MELLARSTDFFVQVAFWTLIHSLWQGTVFAAALAIWRSFAAERDYAARSAAATLTLLFLVAAPTVTATSLALAYEPPTVSSIADDFDVSALAAMPSVLGTTEGDYADEPSPVSLTFDAIAGWTPYTIALLWTMGVTCGAARLVASAVRLHLVRTRSIVADDALARKCGELAERCGLARAPRLLRSFSAGGPYAFGLFRPCIVVPAAWALETSADVLEAAIAHELAHLKRRDLWILALQRLVETTLFFHPAVWYVSRTLNADRERDADRLAAEILGDPARYAESLCRSAALVVRPGSPALTLPFHGETRMNLLERVRYVLRTEEAKSDGFASVGWLCLAPALLAAIFVGRAAFAGSPQADDAPPATLEETILAEEAEGATGFDFQVRALLLEEEDDEPGSREEGEADERDDEGEGEEDGEREGPIADLRRQFAKEKARLDEAMRAEAQALEQKYKEHMAAAQERMAAAMKELQASAQRRAKELEHKFAEAAAQRHAQAAEKLQHEGERRAEDGAREGVPGLDADDLTPRERRLLGVIRSLETRLRELESRLPRDGERREERRGDEREKAEMKESKEGETADDADFDVDQFAQRLYDALRGGMSEEKKPEFVRGAIREALGFDLNEGQTRILLDRARGDLEGFQRIIARIANAKE